MANHAVLGCCVLMLMVSAGCSFGGPSGSLRTVSSTKDRVSLSSGFTTAVYGIDERTGATTIMLADQPLTDILNGEITQGQFMHIELLWVPRAGSTPIDPSATNLSIRHILLDGDQAGVYHGGGFGVPRGKPGGRRWSLAISDATMALAEASELFVDQLEASTMKGSISVRRDDSATRRLHFAVSQLVTDVFGRTIIVDADSRSHVNNS